MNYYDQNGLEFIENTLSLDLTPLYTRFDKYLAEGSKILDIGCGPGRDLKYFSKKYQAMGLEPSGVLAQYARAFSGCNIVESRIQDYSTNEKFDGIWACASLLHLTSTELLDIFQKMPYLLNTKGIMYCSFKHGSFEGMRGDRYFTDLTKKSLQSLLDSSSLSIKESWISKDVRPDRQQEEWLNVFLTCD